MILGFGSIMGPSSTLRYRGHVLTKTFIGVKSGMQRRESDLSALWSLPYRRSVSEKLHH